MTETIEVDRMVEHLKRIIDNLNQHWHSIQLLLRHVSQPLTVDDRGLQHTLSNLSVVAKEIHESFNSVHEAVQTLDISQTYSEIKYIGNRLNGIEQTLEEIKKDGIKRNVNLEFTCDGYELVKKPRGYTKDDPIEEPDQALKELLGTLTAREAKILSHRLGLLGEKAKTYAAMASIFKITGDRCSQVYKKALRKLRHPSRRALLDKVSNKDLRKEVLGEE